MPEVSRFYGIVVHIFYSDHAPPHFHAKYAGQEVLVSIRDLAVLEGQLPSRALGMVTEWASMHHAELLDAWNRAQQHEPPGRIAPLS